MNRIFVGDFVLLGTDGFILGCQQCAITSTLHLTNYFTARLSIIADGLALRSCSRNLAVPIRLSMIASNSCILHYYYRPVKHCSLKKSFLMQVLMGQEFASNSAAAVCPKLLVVKNLERTSLFSLSTRLHSS
jgi:hypothetical protein